MRNLSLTCTSTLSALALATLPGDRAAFDETPTHADFKSASGHIQRVVDGEVIHAVDWDGRPGAESIFRERGRRSHKAWSEFREWSSRNPDTCLRAAGQQACEVLLNCFGPYDARTSEALEAKRSVQRERDALIRRLDGEYPAAVRCAAREYLAPHLLSSLHVPTFPISLSMGDLAFGDSSAFQFSSTLPSGPPTALSAVQAEEVLRRHMQMDAFGTIGTPLDEYARGILDRVKPLEGELDVLDVTEAVMRLPVIPGEGEPADMDRIDYGRLICRHRAVIVGLLLADAGFKLELVSGTVQQDGHQGGHLFLYSSGVGVLEASASGPEFWRSVESAWREEHSLALKVNGGSIYRCHHRTKL